MPNLSRVDPRSLPQLWAWFDATYPNGFGAALPADAAAMSQWNDLSGNGRHLVQATGANQPLFRLTGGPNNLPSVNFVDNTDTMQIATAGAKARPITVVGVFKNTVADDASYHMAVTFNAQRIGVGLDWTGANNTFIARDDAAIMAGATCRRHVALRDGWHPCHGRRARGDEHRFQRGRGHGGDGRDSLDWPCLRGDGVHGGTEHGHHLLAGAGARREVGHLHQL